MADPDPRNRAIAARATGAVAVGRHPLPADGPGAARLVGMDNA